MTKFREIPVSETETQLQFFCPGCDMEHALNRTWIFNNDFEEPTVSPSVLVRGWKGGREGHAYRCHSFIKNGMIEFLADCTHDLKGATVPLPEYK